MNSVQLVGRLTRDPEIWYTNGETAKAVARFCVAVDRKYKTDGQQSADFINCVAFGKTAEFLEKYFKKGQRIGLTGRIQTGSYENKDGQKVYTTDVFADSVEFVESKANGSATDGGKPTPDQASADGFMTIPDDVSDEGLPFN